jgi:hypothetical protein
LVTRQVSAAAAPTRGPRDDDHDHDRVDHDHDRVDHDRDRVDHDRDRVDHDRDRVDHDRDRNRDHDLHRGAILIA